MFGKCYKRLNMNKKASDSSVIGGNLFDRVFFLNCPNYGVQFSERSPLLFGEEDFVAGLFAGIG